MKKSINLLLLTIFSLLILGASSCKKYEDGGNTFRRKNKLSKNSWELNYRKVEFETEQKWSKLVFEKNGDFVIDNVVMGNYDFSEKFIIDIKLNTNIDSANLYLLNLQNLNIEDDNTFKIRVTELTKTKLSFTFLDPSNSYHYEN
jgi:hypothetical protein